jgi:hypothetical protein
VNLFLSLGVEYLCCNLSRYIYLKVQLILAWIINVEAKFVGCIGCHLPNFSDACHAFVHTIGVPFPSNRSPWKMWADSIAIFSFDY